MIFCFEKQSYFCGTKNKQEYKLFVAILLLITGQIHIYIHITSVLQSQTGLLGLFLSRITS